MEKRSMDPNSSFCIGNAISGGKGGWFIGQFFPEQIGLQHQSAVEVKWGQHPKGERRRAFAKTEAATTISVLISGAFVMKLMIDGRLREIELNRPGDYAAVGPDVPHSWEATEDCLVISIRFPSIEASQTELPYS
jgi:hypothetical protein